MSVSGVDKHFPSYILSGGKGGKEGRRPLNESLLSSLQDSANSPLLFLPS